MVTKGIKQTVTYDLDYFVPGSAVFIEYNITSENRQEFEGISMPHERGTMIKNPIKRRFIGLIDPEATILKLRIVCFEDNIMSFCVPVSLYEKGLVTIHRLVFERLVNTEEE